MIEPLTLSADQPSAVLEVLEEEGGRVVVEVDDGCECDCAIESEADEPGQYYHFNLFIKYREKVLSLVGHRLEQLAAAWTVVQLLKPTFHAFWMH